MVRVDHTEAIKLIASLAQQISDGNSNTNRLETVTFHGEYFSIAVHKNLP